MARKQEPAAKVLEWDEQRVLPRKWTIDRHLQLESGTRTLEREAQARLQGPDKSLKPGIFARD
jgi:hypothetical protein